MPSDTRAENPSEGLWKIDSVLNQGSSASASATEFSNQHRSSFLWRFSRLETKSITQGRVFWQEGQLQHLTDRLVGTETRAAGLGSECGPEANERSKLNQTAS